MSIKPYKSRLGSLPKRLLLYTSNLFSDKTSQNLRRFEGDNVAKFASFLWVITSHRGWGALGYFVIEGL